ncbi:MAG TPA: TonB-dependent receptor, partial [Candidatus Obscuribacterales bacterium]
MLKGLPFLGLGAASAVSMMWVQPAVAQTRQVTAVQLNPTANGLEVVLEGLGGRSPQVFTSSYGNVLVADVIGTQLRLPAAETFRQDNPTADIASVTVLVGGRFDFVDLESEDRLFETTLSRNYDVFSPRLGLVYQPTETVSLYASYSRSFRPNSLATTSSGDLLEPERGTQYEIGIKGEFLDGRLAATLAAYNITKKNVATTDPNDLDFSIAAGEIKSRGIELDVVGELAPGWNIIAGYALNDAYISEDNALPEGDQLINAPRNSANLWTTYEIQSGSLRGLGFGAGLYFVGEREAELPNDLELPSFVRTDATIFYRR